MHPAKSVIFFTTASGAGYGLAFLMMLFSMAGLIDEQAALGWTGFIMAGALVTGGLLSSTFHLGHPERAWRALTQWRSSWLSREGVMAVLTYPPVIAYGAGWVFGADLTQPVWIAIGVIGCLCAAFTVYCTAMIYASLKPVNAWHHPVVPIGYGVYAVMTGAVLLSMLARLTGVEALPADATALVALIAGFFVKTAHWDRIDNRPGPSDAGTATGLGGSGRVTLLEAPHSEANYLMREMVFQIARKHSASLRRVTQVAGFALPFLFIAAAILAAGHPAISTVCAIMAAAAVTVGIYTERWLFFAEARHTVALYYGADRA